MSESPVLDLLQFCELASRNIQIDTPCTCRNRPLTGWESMPLSLPETQLKEIASLMHVDPESASFEEYLPSGSDYWSPMAPIAMQFFPYNRCHIWECTLCSRLYLRYTEGGGYFVDQRIRLIDPALIVDVPLPK